MNKNKTIILLTISLLVIFCQSQSVFAEDKGKIFHLKVETANKSQVNILENAVQVFESRLNALKHKAEVKILKDCKNSGELEVKVFGEPDFEKVKRIILYEADLSLVKVVSPANPNLATYPSKKTALDTIGGAETSTRKVFEYDDSDTKQWIVAEFPPIITGEHIRDASAVTLYEGSDDYQISFSLTPEGAVTFGKWTRANIGNYMGVLLNGKAESVAFIQSQIFDKGQISGNFTKQKAEDLAIILKSGYLSAKITLLDEKSFGGESEK